MASRAAGAAFSYPEVGATARRPFPAGYRADSFVVDLGEGASFERAVDGLRHWVPQRGAGARVAPADAPVVEGTTVVVALSFPLLTIAAPCRVVYVTDEPDRFGYAYGTLEGHPERGEESFHVVRDEAGIRFEIHAFSRPVHPLARLGSPVARLLQHRVTTRYLQALQSHSR